MDVRRLATPEEQHGAVRLLGQVWRTDGATVLPPHVARAADHAGSYLAGAYAGGRLVGVCFGLLGLEGEQRRVTLHSHILGVVPPARGSGVGLALKLHQRAWSLERDIREVTWTYDPLVVRNGYFNLVKLGAELVAYHVDFYGRMDDGVNAGDDSDRATVAWRLDAPRVVAAIQRRAPRADVAGLRDAGAPVALDVDDAGAPVRADAAGPAPAMLCRVPDDVERLRRTDPALARAWRRALRDVLPGALAAGYAATAATPDGWYVLERVTA